ncbi:ECF transporter S component [Calderihabitans maritimus]|uniref:Predicted membrane protein n=1 Tax=Calderihabitans maritimus TaxID=1246530 RepID=A0A1Z5HQA8_9FIRM|nr:ECF transporter S component [Calderihabitans maritimus]GAW91716.1 predicted membrane protein [Calderihabitans maritimus]
MKRGGNVTRLAYTGLLIALSTVGSYIKVPSITGTPALDSAPGYFAAMAFGVPEGAVVISLGHLLTALTAGFPLTVPIHLLIAAGMAGCAASVALLMRAFNKWVAAVGGVVLNGIFLPALFIPLPGFGKAFFMAMVIPLVIASALNIGLAVIIYEAMRKFKFSV